MAILRSVVGLVVAIAFTGCSQNLSEAFHSCQNGVSASNVVANGRLIWRNPKASELAHSYVAQWISAQPDKRYILLADIGRDEPLKGIRLRIDDRNRIIDRNALTAEAKCDRLDCVATNVRIEGEFVCDHAGYERYYFGVLIPRQIRRI